MEIKIDQISSQDKPHLKTMLLDYFKEIDNSKIVQTENDETIDYPFLDSYWNEVGRLPLKVLYQNEWIGFALVNEWTTVKEFDAEKSIAEFYVQKESRRKGIGKAIAFQLFNQFKTKWEIRQSSTNLSAIKFWRAVVNEFTRGDFLEIKTETEVIQLFDS